ncbi:MAG: GNAT family N-acetyltransferase [Candidatus Heimdallarchaeaceae archaeon]|jgi:ribosomal protein S18 acetylase RimI-like enzyme
MFQFRRLLENDWDQFTIVDEDTFLEDKMTEDEFLHVINNRDVIGLFSKTHLIGYLVMSIMENYGHLNRIAVRTSEQRKGHGTSLMEYSLDFFKDSKVTKSGLYVETDNEAAISLYKKFNYEMADESWHYIIHEDRVKEIENKGRKVETTRLKIMEPKDFDSIVKVFPTINRDELKTHLEELMEQNYFGSIPLGLFDNDNLLIYGRFNPDYSGCRPFCVADLDYFNDFFILLKQYAKKDYYRITFDSDKYLAEFCKKREYKLWHHLWKMENEL